MDKNVLVFVEMKSTEFHIYFILYLPSIKKGKGNFFFTVLSFFVWILFVVSVSVSVLF